MRDAAKLPGYHIWGSRFHQTGIYVEAIKSCHVMKDSVLAIFDL
jgi:hypothetical protein